MKGNGTKIAIVAGCLLVASFLFYRSLFGQPDVPKEYRDLPKHLPWYKCTKCGQEIQVQADQLDSLQPKEIPIAGEAPAPGLRTAPKMLSYIECPTCKEWTALFSNKCEKHGVVFYSFNPDGSRGACEKCVAESNGSGG